MKYRWIYGLLVLCVCALMLMPSTLAATGPPYVWAAQATLSTLDSFDDQDPENSGFGTTQVCVWEHYNGVDWDIYMNYSLADGAVGTWIMPPLHPATTSDHERHPAVSVTRNHPETGQEIHVVYQRSTAGITWDVCHTYTFNFGMTWSPVTVLDSAVALDSIQPAIVYTEDLTPTPAGGGVTGFLNQIVWAEEVPPAGSGVYLIRYMAHYFDPTLTPTRGWIGPFIFTSSSNPGALSCKNPEIASVDDTINSSAYVYHFSVVWEEELFVTGPPPTPPTQWFIMYMEGRTVTSPGWGITRIATSKGQISPGASKKDGIEPDIAATQDYQVLETYFFHITYQFKTWAGLVPILNSIESHYSVGGSPTPGALSFVATPTVRGPSNFNLDRPTIATKLISLNSTTFQSWVCWEDGSSPVIPNPDIWFREGTYTVGSPPFLWGNVPTPVPYTTRGPPVCLEYNPELWNRNDATRNFPSLTHLVFDMDVFPAGPPGTPPEVEYIDP